MTAVARTGATAVTAGDVLDFLRDECELPDAVAYHALLVKEGYDTLNLLHDLTEDLLLNTIAMKPGHARKFRRQLGKRKLHSNLPRAGGASNAGK